MDTINFLDVFNIKSYPEIIINFLKNNNVKSNINNLRGFYSGLLENISPEIKESYLNRILKYLSSKEESTILILEDISDNIYEKELINFFNEINNLIIETSNSTYFYDNLLNQCSFIFFTEKELNKLKEIYNSKKYTEFLYLLFVHACSDYKINTPKIVAERLLNEAFCLFNTTKSKSVLLKAAADLGNETACTLYGVSIYSNFEKRLNYFLKGKSSPLNLWGIAFIIEHYELTEEQFSTIKNELKYIFEEGNKYIHNIVVINDNNIFHKECTINALKIYLYLANEKNYSKALSSVGKFFLEEKVAIVENNKINKEESIKTGILYSNKAIKLGNIHAMQNVGTYYYNNDPNANVKYKELLQISANAKDVVSNIYTAKILIDEDKTEEVENYLLFLSDENSGEALYKLGKINEARMQIDEAIRYYEKAINNKYYSASIDLAKIYFSKYMNSDIPLNTRTGFLLLAINIIEKNYSLYSEKEKKQADILLKNYKSLI